MDVKAFRVQILGGSLARRLLLRAFMLALTLSIIPFVQILSGTDPVFLDSVNFNECDAPFMITGTNLFTNRILIPFWHSSDCKEDMKLATNVVREIMGKKLLDFSANALCVGDGSASAVYALRELGFANACGAHRSPFFSLRQRRFVYELQYTDKSFDFVFSRDLDEVSIPAVLVLEIERVLKPGGIGAMLVGFTGPVPNGLIRSATPVSLLLKNSNVVHVGYVQEEYTLVVFKKKIDKVGYFEQFVLPADCQSVSNNKPFMKLLEPLVEKKEMGFEKKMAYLPNFMDVHSRKKKVFIEIGASERLNPNVANWFIPSYPVDHKDFNIYFVDHNTSVLLSCVKKPGVTFIYYPGLSAEKVTASIADVEDLDPSLEDEGFDFLGWFRETVEHADFVVLKLRAGETELKFLTELYESGASCFVDELFLSCGGGDNGKTNKECIDLIKSLRSTGMYVHQWWED